ncbi:hypothetical protein [Mesorhizobium sp. ANAO-SY3R2]|uniref:hypothetical protein n=1 Tax=Mesorhizobium sp. ANAO-SY3R2 TaxID=3166644 RepID=UPI00367293EF
MLAKQMVAKPWLAQAFQRDRNSPTKLIAELAGVRSRGFVTADELTQIARIKVAGSGGVNRIEALIRGNTEEAIYVASASAFQQDNPALAVENLLTLRGIRVPLASAVLAWCLPSKWAVIDVHTWSTLREFDGWPEVPTVFTRDHFERYMQRVDELSTATGWEPQKVDRWLFAFSKCGFRISDFD